MTTSPYRSYSHDGDANAPMVLAFHGTGGDEYQFVELVQRMLPQAGLTAPRDDVSEFGANRFFRRTGEGIYDMEDLAFRTGKMLAFVEGVRARYAGRQIYALGYSNGANILGGNAVQAARIV